MYMSLKIKTFSCFQLNIYSDVMPCAYFEYVFVSWKFGCVIPTDWKMSKQVFSFAGDCSGDFTDVLTGWLEVLFFFVTFCHEVLSGNNHKTWFQNKNIEQTVFKGNTSLQCNELSIILVKKIKSKTRRKNSNRLTHAWVSWSDANAKSFTKSRKKYQKLDYNIFIFVCMSTLNWSN